MATLRDVYAPIPQTERGKPVHLGGDPTEKKDIIYCCGTNVIIRDLNNPLKAFIFKEHGAKATVARKSPSGYYYASADVNGNAKVWASGSKVVTLEKQTIGEYYDLQWDGESKRIVGAGIGRSNFAEAWMADSGSSLGSISGHSKPVLSIDIKPSRPFRVVSGGEGNKLNFYTGPPFKFDHSIREHKKYVNCVRFSPDGSKFVSVSSDKRGVVYDGKTGEKLGELSAENGHRLTIYSVSWNDEGTQFLTTSADKTARIWDANTYECVQVFEFENTIENMLVGSLWQGDHLITCSLSGDLTYLNPFEPSTPFRVVSGHQSRLISMAVDHADGKFYTADIDSNVIGWETDTDNSFRIKGDKHGGVIIKTIVNDGNLISIGIDGSLKITPVRGSTEFAPSIEVDGQPRDVTAAGSFVYVLTKDTVEIFDGGDHAASVPLSYEAISIAATPAGDRVAVGDNNAVIRVYNVDGANLTEDYQCTGGHQGDIACLAWSPDGTRLASGGGRKKVACWEGTKNICRQWVKHTSRVNCVAWSPDGLHVISGGVDCNAVIWSTVKKMKKIEIRDAHAGGVTGVAWLDDNTAITAGADMCANVWDIEHIDV